MLGIRAGMAQKDCYSAMQRPLCLDQVVHTPVCATTDACGFRLQKTVESPQLQSFLLVVIPVVAQMQFLMVPSPQSFSSCSTLIRWSTFVV